MGAISQYAGAAIAVGLFDELDPGRDEPVDLTFVQRAAARERRRHRVTQRGAAIDGLGVGMVAGTLVISPFGVRGLSPISGRPLLLLLALSTGLLSNVIPYGIDQIVMTTITRARFAFLQAVLPLTAAVVGFAALSQTPNGRELLGIGLVVATIVARGTHES